VQNRLKVSSTPVDEIKDMAHDEVEIIYIGRQQPFWTRTHNRPLRIGCSVSPSTVTYSGTLGCFCRDNATKREGMLSNNHVFADVNRTPLGTTIIQKARGDGGDASQDVVGRLDRFVPIQFGGVPNGVDAAFASLENHGRGEDRHSLFDNRTPPLPVVTVQPSTKVEAFPEMDVLKTGRTTGHTQGRVRAIDVNNLVVNMGSGLGPARFDGQISFQARTVEAGAFGRSGDSGSLIVDDRAGPWRCCLPARSRVAPETWELSMDVL
jgi:hypothetical protein